MEICIDRTKLKKQDVDTSELIERISTGQAILFTGAGFSSLTKNVNDEEPSAAKDLAHEICKLGGFPTDDDLRFATDYYIENHNVSELIQLLKKSTLSHKLIEFMTKFAVLNGGVFIQLTMIKVSRWHQPS